MQEFTVEISCQGPTEIDKILLYPKISEKTPQKQIKALKQRPSRKAKSKAE